MKLFARKGSDVIEIEITDEALIKLSADKVSPAQHNTVESIYGSIARLSGGTPRRVLKPNVSLAQALHVHAADGHTHTH